MKILKRLLYILNESDIIVVEIFLTFLTFIDGLWMVYPHKVSAISISAYRTMYEIFPNMWAWGLLFVGASFVSLLGIVNNNIHNRRFGSFLMFLLWTFVTFTFIYSNLASIGVPTAFGFAAMSAWIHWRTISQSH